MTENTHDTTRPADRDGVNASGPPFRDVSVCAEYCEPAYGRDAFPDTDTQFASDSL